MKNFISRCFFSMLVVTGIATNAVCKPLPAISVTGGDIQGVVTGEVIAYKGIPYAAAPVGDLRWKPPQPVIPWEGVRKVADFGFDCMQNPFAGDAAPLGGPISEDCLYVNVWKPAGRAEKPRPVIVWIHGGGFVNGGTSPAVYSGDSFASHGVVFVSFNYRLGRFGFFSHPALSKESGSDLKGNYGFMDQIAALKWVKDNIDGFDGDPENITLFGESAGGRSVNTLMTLNPEYVSGLFHKAISQSGGGREKGWGYRPLTNALKHKQDPRPSAQEIGLAFAEANGIKGAGAEALRALRRLPAQAIVNGMNLVVPQPDTYSGPIIDGVLIRQSVEAAFLSGDYLRLPYIAGANDGEFAFMAEFAPERSTALAKKFIETLNLPQKTLERVYGLDLDKPADIAYLGGLIQGDSMFVEPARYLVGVISTPAHPAWLYRFDHIAEALQSKTRGAYHATEIPFVFNTVAQRYDRVGAQDRQVSGEMHRRWIAFAESGDPNVAGLAKWQPYNENREKIMLFSSGGSAYKVDPAKARLDLVERFTHSAEK